MKKLNEYVVRLKEIHDHKAFQKFGGLLFDINVGTVSIVRINTDLSGNRWSTYHSKDDFERRSETFYILHNLEQLLDGQEPNEVTHGG